MTQLISRRWWDIAWDIVAGQVPGGVVIKSDAADVQDLAERLAAAYEAWRKEKGLTDAS